VFRESRQLVWNRAKLAEYLTLIDAAAPSGPGPFALGEVRLFTNSYDPTPDMVPSDFVEPTFNGYPAVGSATFWVGPVNALSVGLVQPTIFWAIATEPIGTPATVQGYWYLHENGTEAIFAERFLDPVVFALGGDYLTLMVKAECPFIWPASPP